MERFALHSQLATDTKVITDLGLCRILLMNDVRFPWLILVPKRENITEIHELTPLDQTMLTFEISEISGMLKDLTDCKKINVGALGNIVPQLHVHVIARDEDDAAWPGPVWGSGTREPYGDAEAQNFIDRIAQAMQSLD